jgi:diguanylate cyclase (GGDEF)-like protein
MTLLAPTIRRWRDRLSMDMFVILALAIVISTLSVYFDGFEWLHDISRSHEAYQIDEFVTFGFFLSLVLVVFSWRRVLDQRREIEARKRAEEYAQQIANADSLTGLPNRRRLEIDFDTALGQTRPHRKRAFLLFDLNRFKPINDVYGHQAGDRVLIDFAHRVSATIGRDSTMYRLGGDEFAVLTGPFSDIDQVSRMARRIVAAMDSPVAIGHTAISVGVGIGISVAPDDGTTRTELMRRADVALYRAKTQMESEFHFYEPSMDQHLLRRSHIEAAMRTAITDGSIRPHFQPIVRLSDGRIVGFEALARWTHPTYGELAPQEFIAIAEDSGIMPLLTLHLLRRACEAATSWPDNLILSVNLSPAEIGDPTLVLRVLKTLGDSGLSPRRLEIEVTESALVRNFETAQRTLTAFRDAGISIALDDFGKGNSSLQHLRELRFDRLKIHSSFIRQMMVSPEAAAMVSAILHMAKALDLTTTAEGIEQAAQIDLLAADGCVEAQGHHFGAALPAESLEGFIGNSKRRATARRS